jgi:hypothetical protein
VFALTLLVLKVTPKVLRSQSPNTPAAGPGPAGLSVGEVVDLPELSTLDGSPASLKGLAENHTLCVVFSTRCSECSEDVPLWRALNAEAAKHHTAFRVISLDDERDRIKRYAEAYEFANLPVLFDPNHYKLGQVLKITFVPEYLLLDSRGRVLGRWTGIQQHDQAKNQSADLDHFFDPASSN